MKILQTSVFRAVCAVIIGALLVRYRDEMVTWLTISIGVLFALSGIILSVYKEFLICLECIRRQVFNPIFIFFVEFLNCVYYSNLYQKIKITKFANIIK